MRTGPTGNTTSHNSRQRPEPSPDGDTRGAVSGMDATLTLSRLCAPALRGGPAVPLNP